MSLDLRLDVPKEAAIGSHTWTVSAESTNGTRVALPVADLPSYGIQIVPEISVTSVEADLLVAQDGHARAIRLVHSMDSSRSSTP